MRTSPHSFSKATTPPAASFAVTLPTLTTYQSGERCSALKESGTPLTMLGAIPLYCSQTTGPPEAGAPALAPLSGQMRSRPSILGRPLGAKPRTNQIFPNVSPARPAPGLLRSATGAATVLTTAAGLPPLGAANTIA